jgi:hypothetical protein
MSKDDEAKTPNLLCKRIMKSRNIKETSCNTYMSALNKIRKKIIPDADDYIKNTNFLKDYKKVMVVIDSEKKLTSKKNKLTAVIVALSSDKPKNQTLIDRYSDTLKKYSDNYMAFLKTQKKTETQKQNWITYDELIGVANKLLKEVKHREINKMKSDADISNKNFDVLQEYLILRTYITFPLRNDFADMKILKATEFKKLSKEDKVKKNYLLLFSNNKKQFRLNQYKNSRFLGSKKLNVPAPLNRVINLWLRFNSSGYYLVRTDRKTPMTPNHITKFLNKIFQKYTQKKISTSMIRHIVISNLLKDEKTIAQKEEEAKKIENTFLHSNKINQLYRKVDD